MLSYEDPALCFRRNSTPCSSSAQLNVISKSISKWQYTRLYQTSRKQPLYYRMGGTPSYHEETRCCRPGSDETSYGKISCAQLRKALRSLIRQTFMAPIYVRSITATLDWFSMSPRRFMFLTNPPQWMDTT